jgi:D-sedoheptulose 7-phosphate isomerase
MSDHSIIDNHLHGLAELARRTAETLAADIAKVAAATHACLEAGGKLMYCGNGGSAADAQHIATEYVVRFQRNRTPMAAIALTTDTSLLTAASNDFSFENVFERQVQALGRAGDILFLHSTSGESPNLLRAADAARVMGVTSVALLARGGGRLVGKADIALIVPTDDGAHAQEIHLAISHTICQLVEHRFFGEP